MPTLLLMACGQHVPIARKNIHTHKLLQYKLYTTYTITAIATNNYSWLKLVGIVSQQR